MPGRADRLLQRFRSPVPPDRAKGSAGGPLRFEDGVLLFVRDQRAPQLLIAPRQAMVGGHLRRDRPHDIVTG